MVIVTSTGGTGSFRELALVSREEDGWVNTDTALLGDRVEVRSLAFQNDTVVVDLTVHGPTDPMCCPTVETRARLAIRDGRLVPLAEQRPD